MVSRKKLSDILGVHPKWLPASTHAEKIAEWVKHGSCRIEHRGHGNSPLLVFEDGGSMELPSVRWENTVRGWCLVSAADTHAGDSTTHADVCGTVDALKSTLTADPETTGLSELVDDMESMIRRMQSRREEYATFLLGVEKALGKPIRPVAADTVAGQIDALRNELSKGPRERAANTETIVELAEQVRSAAQSLEDSLADCRGIALELTGSLRKIKGSRSWPDPQS